MPSPSLIVAIRGWTNTGDLLLGGTPGGEIPESTLAVLREALPGAVVWAPEFPLSMFDMRDPEVVVRDLFHLIDEKVATLGEVESIVLLGYSAGSVLARRVFCMAHGAATDGSVDPSKAAPWAHRVHRLVVLAGITRGWQFSTASPDHVRFFSPILFGIARLVGWLKSLSPTGAGRLPFIWQLKRGAPFVVSTRIQYVRVMSMLRQRASASTHPLRAEGLPSTIFLLGSKDEFISPDDCTELGPRAEFAYVELKGSNHAQVLRLAHENGKDDENPETVASRRERIVAAMSCEFHHLLSQDWALPPSDIDDYLDPMDLLETSAQGAQNGDHVQHAVMIVHGIRDNGFWTKRVAREVKTQARLAGIAARAPSPSYGFFSMWDFVRPGGRRDATYWFMERYADVRSHFPNAVISFVGHSNGTYIAANAMKLCLAIRFERVVFAGSVARRDYPWNERAGQVKEMLNYVGTNDGVVAFLPAVFEFLGLRFMDVGGAGAFGFHAAHQPEAVRPLELAEVRYVQGGHGAAIDEEFWPEIANFVLAGKAPMRVPAVRSRTIQAVFACAPLVTVLGLGLAAVALALPLVAAAWVAQVDIENLMSGKNDGWLPTVLANSPAAWQLCAIAVVGAGILVSWVARRFLRAW